MNNKMITIPYADAIEYGENTSALFKALWELTDLIRLESDLKKHHRAYLHVREDIDEKVKEARQIMTKVSVDMIGFYFKVDVPESSNSDENTPFADAADDEAVSIPKDRYELMIDDLLTMSEIIQCVADMRTQDMRAIHKPIMCRCTIFVVFHLPHIIMRCPIHAVFYILDCCIK